MKAAASATVLAFALFAQNALAQPAPDPGRSTPTPPTGAAADTAPGKPGTSEVEAEPGTTAAAPKTDATSPDRKMPDYDGRGDPPATTGQVLLWIPRIIFSPIYFVTEYVIRRPIGWFITTAERNQWPSAVVDFFTFGPDKKAGVVPTALIDFGFKPSVGVYAFWDDLLGKDNHLRLHASTWGADWLSGSIADKIAIDKNGGFFDMRFEGLTRPDKAFWGMGPRSIESDRIRYGIDQFQARPVFETFWWRGSRISLQGGVKYVKFRDENCCEEASLADQIRKGAVEAPPGFSDGGGYTKVFQRGEITVDTREPRPANQSGFRLELETEQAANVRKSADNWLHYGASVGGFWDIKDNRVVSLSVSTLFVDPLSKGATIPFTEQVVLGGDGLMRGYLLGRLIDRSAAVATLKYRWPIWIFLDGTLQGAIGNVFGPQLEGFKTSLLRLNGAVGVESIGGADHTFELLLGFGTETFDHGANVNSFRLVFGTNRGF